MSAVGTTPLQSPTKGQVKFVLWETVQRSLLCYFDEGTWRDLEEKNKCITFAVEFIGMDWLRSSTE